MTYTKTKLRSVALGFAMAGMVLAIISIIPMCWILPMSLSIKRDIDENKPIPTALAVCYLIFGGLCGMVSGILLLVDNGNQAKVEGK